MGDGPGSCSDELAFADPDVEAVVRDLVHISAGPIFTKDVLTLTDLGALLTVVGTCAPNDCGHPNPPAKDDWITSLDGVQCLTAVERIAMDAWSVLDYSPLAALGRLSYLYAGLTLDLALFPVLPAVTQLEVIYTERGLTGLSSFPALESLTVSARDLAGDHALDPLAPLVKLRSVVIARSHVTNLSALAALPRITTLNLARNDIADLSPLLQNGGLGEGDTVDVSENPINCAGQAEILRLLRARGVVVKVDCP